MTDNKTKLRDALADAERRIAKHDEEMWAYSTVNNDTHFQVAYEQYALACSDRDVILEQMKIENIGKVKQS